jgi:hypothetical protein
MILFKREIVVTTQLTQNHRNGFDVIVEYLFAKGSVRFN